MIAGALASYRRGVVGRYSHLRQGVRARVPRRRRAQWRASLDDAGVCAPRRSPVQRVGLPRASPRQPSSRPSAKPCCNTPYLLGGGLTCGIATASTKSPGRGTTVISALAATRALPGPSRTRCTAHRGRARAPLEHPAAQAARCSSCFVSGALPPPRQRGGASPERGPTAGFGPRPENRTMWSRRIRCFAPPPRRIRRRTETRE